MAASRLRRTFHYPSESDDEDAVEHGMDEQDQTNLISTLTTQDTSSTRLYTTALSILVLVPAVLHAPFLLRTSTLIPTLAAITSFIASAYALYFLPLPPVKVGIITTSELQSASTPNKNKKGAGIGGYGFNTPFTSTAASTSNTTTKHERKPVPYISEDIADTLANYIVPGNAAVCVLLAVYELWHGRLWNEGVNIGGGYLPGVVLSVVMWARRELRVIDLSELERLKFGGKDM